MRVMGLEAVYPKPRLSQPGEGHKTYPYRLQEVKMERVDQVWSTDITYIRMAQGLVYLVAVMDWYSRFVLSWALSVTMEVPLDRKSTRLNSSHLGISYAVLCLKKKLNTTEIKLIWQRECGGRRVRVTE